MSQFLSVSNERSDGIKLVRFFRLVGFLGGMVLFARALIVMVILGSILFTLK